jgi:hypothetical protein
VLHRRISVDHERNVINMDATRCDIGSDHGRCRSVGECRKISRADILRKISVHLDRNNSVCVQLTRELLGAMLRTSENNCATRCGGKIDDDGKSIVVRYVQHVVGHGVDRRLFGINAVCDWIRHVALDDDIDALVERC